METREEQRRRVLGLRDALSEADRMELSRNATERLLEFIHSRNAKFVHCYISVRSELRTREFIARLLQEGIRVVVPVVEELDGASFLIHTEIRGLHNLQRGRFGLDEPIERSVARLDGLDLVVLPLAVFDRAGNRLGYGKGFYDKFLSELPSSVLRIGLGFDRQEVEHVDAHSHDQPLDLIVTETRTIVTESRSVTDSQSSVTDSQSSVTDSQSSVTDSQSSVTDSQSSVTDNRRLSKESGGAL